MALNGLPDAEGPRWFFRFQPRSLRQRLVLFVLLPVAVLLFSMGLIGFVFARNSMLVQWREAAVLKLQRAAHHVDMRLVEPKEWMGIFSSRTAGSMACTAKWEVSRPWGGDRPTCAMAAQASRSCRRAMTSWWQEKPWPWCPP